MIRNLSVNRNLWLLTASLALAASAVGVASPGIYDSVVSDDIAPGVLSQDLITVALSTFVLLLVFRMRDGDTMKQIAVVGILGYFFYGYGIYVIEQIYTVLYFVYLAIFSLSAYLIVLFLASIRRETLNRVTIGNSVRFASVAFLIIIAVMFVALWTSQLVPLMEGGEKKEFTFSIYILDLCFIMPACVIAAVMSMKRQGLGILMTPALFVIGSTVLASPALGEALKPLLFDMSAEVEQMGLFLILSVTFLALAMLNFFKIRIQIPEADERQRSTETEYTA